MLKIDETTLQHILRTYGKPGRPAGDRGRTAEPPASERGEESPSSPGAGFDGAGYDRSGNVQLDPEKRKALIDFFR